LEQRVTKDHIQFFFEGDEYYESLWQDLRAAQRSIYIQAYMLAADTVGKHLKAILIAKAITGIDVRLSYDGIGSYGLARAFIDDLRKAGVKTREHHPVGFFNLFQQTIYRRDHRKVLLIDDDIGYLGGFNLHEMSSFKHFGKKRWRDTQIRVTGEWVTHLRYYVHNSFGLSTGMPKRFRPHARANVILLNHGPRAGNPIRRMFHRNIRRARSAISITTAYFVPDLRTMFLLWRARKRGVAVTIITARDVIDVTTVNRANRWLMRFLIKRGIRIFCFTTRMLHAKTAYFDGAIGTVGSSNVNYRSFFWDVEINAFFRHEKWVQQLIDQQVKDLDECREITLGELDNVPWWQRAVDAVFYLIKSFF
jgi:cardiolipin synthase